MALSHTHTSLLIGHLFLLQVLSALDILQPPHLDFFQEMYPFQIKENPNKEKINNDNSPILALFLTVNQFISMHFSFQLSTA